MRFPLPRTLIASVVALAAIAALASCGGDDSKPKPKRPVGVSFSVANKIKIGVSKSEVVRRLGSPVLTGSPTAVFPRGCLYFAMKGKPLSDVWQFCFDKRSEVAEGATLYSPMQPKPPADASPARAVLIARGDAFCNVEKADLVKPTKRINKALSRLARSKSKANRKQLAKALDEFNTAITKVVTNLKTFDAPADERSALTGYIDKRAEQAKVLDQARDAQLAGDDARYDQLGSRFTALGDQATPLAKRYGFTICTAPRFK